jgi:hypothetical protein
MPRADKEEKEADSTFVQFAIRTLCDKKKFGHTIIKTRNTYIKWWSLSQNYPLGVSQKPLKFLLSSIMKGSRSLRAH